MNISMDRKQKGFSLTEALVAFVITAVGLIAIASFQAGLFSTSAHNKARTEALALAQEKIEVFKDYTLLSESNFIDSDGDGVMDPDGTYEDDPIDGQNAQFTRSWVLTTDGPDKQIDVTVSWQDSADEAQSVALGTLITWIAPRAEGDQMAKLAKPFLASPTGRAEIGEGNLSDYPEGETELVRGPDDDGLSLYRHDEDMLLVDVNGDILLTLIDACSTIEGTCKDFVKISGTVYVDTANTRVAAEDIHVIAADASHCQRWVPTGNLANPPSTATGDYRYYNYNCYLGGGWHGNIGFVTTAGLRQRDKVCQGDPTSIDAWSQPVIALRRAYRGMIHKGNGAGVQYFSHGIKDAAVMTGHDFVFTELSPELTDGSHCVGANGPMTRPDSAGGALFQEVPTDFVCLNTDDDGDSAPDYLDSFDTDRYEADTHCPYDPTDPPVQHHVISGVISIQAEEAVNTSNFSIVTSDGPGNCELDPFAAVMGGYEAAYSCDVFDWGSGWTGYISIDPDSNYIYCPSRVASFSAVQSDQSHNFGCTAGPTITIEGPLNWSSSTATISSLVITDTNTGLQGSCRNQNDVAYYCQIPYSTADWDGTIAVTSNEHVCYANSGVFSFANLTAAGSSYTHEIRVAKNASSCP